MKVLIACTLAASLAASSAFAGNMSKVVVEQEPAVVKTSPALPVSSLPAEAVGAGIGLVVLIALMSNKSKSTTSTTGTTAMTTALN